MRYLRFTQRLHDKRRLNNVSYNLGREEMYCRIGNEDSRKLLDDIEKLESIVFADDRKGKI